MTATRFKVLTAVGTLVSAVLGVVLIYVALAAWQAGEISFRGSLIRAANSPVQFYLLTVSGAALGLGLALSSPFQLSKLWATARERSEISNLHPKLYGKTRASLVVLLVVLLTSFLTAWLLSR